MGERVVMAWTYILRCSDGSYYAGSTVDRGRRMEQHQAGAGSRYTASRTPVGLVWALEFDRVVDAFVVEKQIQNWSRAKREALVEGRLEDLPALARGRSGRPLEPPA